MTPLKEEIKAALEHSSSLLSCEQIFEACKGAEAQDQVAKVLYDLKKAGEIVGTKGGPGRTVFRYRLAKRPATAQQEVAVREFEEEPVKVDVAQNEKTPAAKEPLRVGVFNDGMMRFRIGEHDIALSPEQLREISAFGKTVGWL